MCGIRNPATRKKLLSEGRTFQQALEVAIVVEIEAKESVQIQQQLPHIQSVNSVSKNCTISSSSSVDSIYKNSAVLPSSGGNSRVPPSLRQGVRPNSPSPPQSNSHTCFSCGNAGHVRSKCKFRNATCRNCNMRGQITRACRKNEVNVMCATNQCGAVHLYR